jgi:O-antigen ligase
MLQAIVASLSRMGMLTVAAAFLLWVFRFRRFDVLRFTVPAAIILGLALTFASPEWRERFSTMTTAEARASDPSIQSRMLQYRNSISAFASSPLVGVGFRHYELWAMEQRFPVGARSIHNAYLRVLAELGLIGIVSYLMVLLLTWRDLSRAWLTSRRKNINGDPELRRLYLYAVFLQIGFLGALVGGLCSPALRYRVSWLLFASSPVVLGFVRARVAELEAGDAAVAGSDALSGAFSAGATQTVGG